MRNQNFEVPFLAYYRKEYVEPELDINALWRVYHFDAKVSLYLICLTIALPVCIIVCTNKNLKLFLCLVVSIEISQNNAN